MHIKMMILACAAAVAAFAETVTSPDGKIKVDVTADGTIRWSATRNGQPLVLPSKLGLDFIAEAPWTYYRLMKTQRRQIDSTWTTRLYHKERVRNRANELELFYADANDRRMNIIFRVYDEGVAFRYVIPKQASFDGFLLRGEFTEWRFPKGTEGIFTSYKGYVTSQEELFLPRAIADIKPEEYVGTPAIVKVGGQAVALCEAALSDWAGCFFRTPKRGQDANTDMLGTFLTPLPPSNACARDTAVIRMPPAASPWRVMMCADNELDLIRKRDIIANLNPDPEPGLDFSWVEPGASSWDWWVESNNSLSTDLSLKLVDFAAEMGWKYHTIDGGWYGWARRPNHGPDVPVEVRKGFDLAKIVAHAKAKGVGIFVWIHWEALDDSGVEETLAKLARWGVKGVKIDFMDRQDQKMVRWYERVARAAAKNRLLVNFHGAFKPTGTERTWPNNLTREAIRGNEVLKWSNSIDAVHTAMLPFTRYLLGPGDYTPGGFGNVYKKNLVPQLKRGHRYGDEKDHRVIWTEEIGTRAHALALCIAYESRLMTLCDWPDRYRSASGIDALRNLPAAWKNTAPIAGEPGKFYAVAREAFDGRHFLAAITVDRRTLNVPLKFLGNGNWTATVYADDPKNTPVDPQALEVMTRSVTARDTLPLDLLPEGGAVAVFTRN